MAEPVFVSAVIVNWNGAKDLKVALPSLRRQSHSPLEILVVDNGSADNSNAVVSESGAVWIGLTRNEGLAVAFNQGARRAIGEYVIFLNNDMRFAPDFVEQLVGPLTQDERLFATDARQLNWAGTEDIHLATRLARRSLVDSYLHPGLIPLLDIPQAPAAVPVVEFQACSAAMAVRRNMFEALGGFDERFLVSWEDTEICWRAWLRGWHTIFVPRAVCWHRIGGSAKSSRGATARVRGIVGGRLLFATKHLPWFYLLNTWVVSCLGAARDVVSARLRDALVKGKVIAAYASVLPRLLAERRRMYAESGVSPSIQLRRMLDLGRASHG